MSGVPGVAASAPLTALGGNISGENGRYDEGFVIGTTGDLPSLLNQSIAYGSFFSDENAGATAGVLGQHAGEILFNEDVPLGRSFTFHGERFIVRGVFNQFTAAPLSQGLDFNNAVFIPNEQAEKLSNGTAPTYEILARPDIKAAWEKLGAEPMIMTRAEYKAHIDNEIAKWARVELGELFTSNAS